MQANTTNEPNKRVQPTGGGGGVRLTVSEPLARRRDD